jgi:hypothetical protein
MRGLSSIGPWRITASKPEEANIGATVVGIQRELEARVLGKKRIERRTEMKAAKGSGGADPQRANDEAAALHDVCSADGAECASSRAVKLFPSFDSFAIA